MNDKEVIDQLRSTVFKLMEENKKYEKVIKIIKRVFRPYFSKEGLNPYALGNQLEELTEEEWKLLKEVFNYVLH